MREVRVYDGDFPSMDRVLAGDPTAAFPKEVWLPQVRPGEFAVRYKDFKTGLARNPAGQPIKSGEICRIFSSLEEARSDCKEIVNQYWVVRCFVYDHTGTQVDAISNNKDVGKFAAAMYTAMLVWAGAFAVVGMSALWLLYRATLLVLKRSPSEPPLVSGWLGWSAYVAAGVLIGILLWFVRIQFAAARKVSRMHRKLKLIVPPEERKRFEELNTLHGSGDSSERERFLKLAAEYHEKVREALKE